MSERRKRLLCSLAAFAGGVLLTNALWLFGGDRTSAYVFGIAATVCLIGCLNSIVED